MRVTVQHSLKIPAEQEYSSRQHSVAMEVDVPEEIVQQGKEAIRTYVASVAGEVRSYVEDALGRPAEPRPSTPIRSISRTGPAARLPGRTPARNSGNGAESGNGHPSASGRPGEAASLKQVNYLRSLARDARYSSDQLALFVEEIIGRNCALNALSKREASMVIESMKANAA